MTEEQSRTYQVRQYLYDEHGARNNDVSSFEDLVTHHPKANFHAQMSEGELRNVERPSRRSHAFIGGELQEVEMLRTDEYMALKPDQILLVKDFILEDSPLPGAARTREVDVPAPVAGHIGRRDDQQGLVEIYDKPDGDVIARVRHMDPVAVNLGDYVVYGQSLGTQHEKGLKPGTGKHVHMEVDTRYFRQFESYISDLVSGRLPVQAEFRANVQPMPMVDDGTFRLGESDDRIRDLQRVMANEDYRGVGGRSLDQDGVYRLGMQGALLDFQRTHGVPQTGNIDPPTLNFAPPERRREIDRLDYFVPGQSLPATPEPTTAPGHPDHPDHRPGLPQELEPAVNRSGNQQAFSTGDPDLDRLAATLFANDEKAFSQACRQIEKSPQVQQFEQWGRELAATQQRDELQQQEMARQTQGPAMRL